MASDYGYQVHLEKDSSFLVEIWAWYIVGILTITMRYVARIRTVGISGLAVDDYITFLTLIFYTIDGVLVHIVYHTGANADLTQDIVDRLSRAQIHQFTLGSACQTVAWYSYTALIWAMKFTMLFFYKRLTFGTLQNRMIKYLFWLCGITYLAVVLTITFGCYPMQDNWEVYPTLPGRKCTFKTQNLLVTVTLNVITDAAILIIPIPLLWRLKVGLSRKIAIAALLSSGVFVIAAAITRAALTLGEAPSALNINRWGVRETIVGIVAVQLPMLRPLFGREFWRWGPYRGAVGGSGGGGGGGGGGTGSGSGGKTGSGGGTAGGTLATFTGNGSSSKHGRSHHHHLEDGAIELHDAKDVDIERASTYSKEQPSSIAVVELLERDRHGHLMYNDERGRAGSGAPSDVSSTDSEEVGFVERERRRMALGQHGHGHEQQGSMSLGQQGQSRQFHDSRSPTRDLEAGGRGDGVVFVETTYEIRREGRLSGDCDGGAARGEVGCDTRITALRGWGR